MSRAPCGAVRTHVRREGWVGSKEAWKETDGVLGQAANRLDMRGALILAVVNLVQHLQPAGQRGVVLGTQPHDILHRCPHFRCIGVCANQVR